MPSPVVSLITPLADAGRSRKTGAKAVNLSRLIAARFAVPRGFVISSDAYRAHLWTSGVRELATALAEAEDREQVRTAILSQPLPDDINVAIIKAYGQLALQIGDRNPKVAVRPSAEEPNDADFPGAYESFINVSGEEALLSAVRRVWASLWSGKAAAFRARSSLTGEPVMAVIVQQMVEAAVSGTASTANPVTGDPRRVMVSLASDGREPMRLEIDLAGSLARRQDGAGAIPPEAALAAEKSVMAEEVCEGPVEIEWAFDGHQFWVLHVRPIWEQSGAFPIPDELDEASEWRLLSRRPVSRFSTSLIAWKPKESLPGPPRHWGGTRTAINGYVYTRAPLEAARKEGAELAAGAKALRRWREQVEPVLTRRCRDMLRADLAQADWPTLRCALMDAADASHAACEWLDAICHPASRFPAIARRMVGDEQLFLRLMGGLQSPVVVRDAKLHDLAERFALAEETGRAANPDWWLDYKADVTGFACDYGFALPDEADSCDCAAWRSWGEDTDSVFRLISALVRLDKNLSLVTLHCAAEQDAAAAAEALPPGELRGRRFKTILKLARDWLAVREESEMACALALSALRRAVLEIGSRLHACGMIADVGDVFQLTLDELLDAPVEPTADDRAAFARLIARRKHELWLDSRLSPPDTLPLKSGSPDAPVVVVASPGWAVGTARRMDELFDASEFGVGDILIAGGYGSAWTPLLAVSGGLVIVGGNLLSTAALLAREYGLPAVVGCSADMCALNDKLVTVNGSEGSVEIGRRLETSP